MCSGRTGNNNGDNLGGEVAVIHFDSAWRSHASAGNGLPTEITTYLRLAPFPDKSNRLHRKCFAMGKSPRDASAHPDDDYEIVFTPRFRHWRSGKIIVAAPGRVFALRIRKNRIRK